MPDTHGFEVVVEARASVLKKALWGAWKSAECPEDPGEEGRIPETMDIDATDGFEFNGYEVTDGQVQIPQDQLDATLAPDIDGAELKFGLNIQAEVDDPPVPSAALLTLSADVRARAPIIVPAGEEVVVIQLDGLPPSSVTATLTSPNPVTANANALTREYIHQLYELDDDNVLPHDVTQNDIVFYFGQVTVDSFAEIYDDLADPAHAITVTGPAAGEVTISIPIYLRLHNIRLSPLALLVLGSPLEDPMGIETRISITAPFEDDNVAGLLIARFDAVTAADIAVDTPVPAGPDHGVEGPNYTANKAKVAALGNLEQSLKEELAKRGLAMALAIGREEIAYPTNAQIEQAIAKLFHAELITRGRVAVWTPTDAPDVDFVVGSVNTRVFADMFAIALNAGAGADIGAMTSFIPDGREFAIGLSADRVNAAIAAAREDNGLRDSDLPKRVTADGEDVDINELDVGLRDGSIRISGEVTVIDAILDSIDVDADFTSDIGLQWVDSGAGQRIEDFQIGEPEIDPEESVLFWVIGLIIGIVTGGIGGLLIAALILLIITLIVNSIASSIGGSVVTDEVSGKVVGFGGWPEQLSRIGRVTTRFENPITIQTSGLIMAGNLDVISSCEDTAVAFADSGGAKTGSASSALTLEAQNTHADALYRWSPGDGSPEQLLRDISHVYDMSGFYVAKHTLRIDQAGGARSRHFAGVSIANIPPHDVDAGPDIVADEGEVVTLVGRFRDVEYLDTHETMWTFGDHQPPKAGVVSETHFKPQAVGSSTVEHAWCDNGSYIVTFTVRDQNGGVTVDTLKAVIRNIPPVVDAGPDLFAYRCMAITLTGRFEDKGWCDTHVGSWDFGDCSPPQTAIIRETNEPPAATGTVVGTHIYECCGRFVARCTVDDDDGASGSDDAIVDVVELLNPGFEEGFRQLAGNKIGNGWTPYVLQSRKAAAIEALASGQAANVAGTTADKASVEYDCEECIVHEGQRSQRIAAGAGSRAGLFQKLGANPGWAYQVSSWAFTERGAVAWLGIDPTGGDDPEAATIVWNPLARKTAWGQLSERVTATGLAITIFLETECDERPANAYHDEIAFVAIQDFCEKEPKCDDREEPKPEEPRPEVCAGFVGQQPGDRRTAVVIDGFAFSSLSGGGVTFAPPRPPAGHPSIAITLAGIDVRLPFAAARVTIALTYEGGKPIETEALDEAGDRVAGLVAGTTQGAIQTLVLAGAAIHRVHIVGQEGGLVSVCAERDRKADKSDGRREQVTIDKDDHVKTKADPYLVARLTDRSARADDTVEVIISVGSEVRPASTETARGDPEKRAAEFERDVADLIAELESQGATSVRPLWLNRSVAAVIPLAALRGLESRSDVGRITSDRKQKLI